MTTTKMMIIIKKTKMTTSKQVHRRNRKAKRSRASIQRKAQIADLQNQKGKRISWIARSPIKVIWSTKLTTTTMGNRENAKQERRRNRLSLDPKTTPHVIKLCR